MAHKIHMRLPKEQIMNSDVQFIVKSGNTKLGELHISKGNVEWWPSGNSKKKYRMRCTKLAKMFVEDGTLVKENA